MQTSKDKNNIDEKIFHLIQNALREIQYGSVTLVIQDGKIIQIDKNEKIRIR